MLASKALICKFTVLGTTTFPILFFLNAYISIFWTEAGIVIEEKAFLKNADAPMYSKPSGKEISESSFNANELGSNFFTLLPNSTLVNLFL